jgi:multiple sugar transport system permease protein
MMLPMILYIIPLYRFIFQLNLGDTVLGVALPIMISPLSVFIMLQFLEDLPKELIEAARIDGAGHFRIYFSIVLPLMRNGLITAIILLFLRSWGAYLWPSLVTGKEINPISVTIANLLSRQFYIDPRVKIASMLITMIPPLVVYLLFQKYVIKGISMSSVKG